MERHCNYLTTLTYAKFALEQLTEIFLLSRDRPLWSLVLWYVEISQQRDRNFLAELNQNSLPGRVTEPNTFFTCHTQTRVARVSWQVRVHLYTGNSEAKNEKRGADAPRDAFLAQWTSACELWLCSSCPSVPYIESWREGMTILKRNECVWIMASSCWNLMI